MLEEHNCLISTSKHVPRLRYRAHTPKTDPSLKHEIIKNYVYGLRKKTFLLNINALACVKAEIWH